MKKRFLTPGWPSVLFLRFSIFFVLSGAVLSHAQMGVATGNGVATPAKPLPPGMKPPTVQYEDIASQAGLTGVNVSGADAEQAIHR